MKLSGYCAKCWGNAVADYQPNKGGDPVARSERLLAAIKRDMHQLDRVKHAIARGGLHPDPVIIAQCLLGASGDDRVQHSAASRAVAGAKDRSPLQRLSVFRSRPKGISSGKPVTGQNPVEQLLIRSHGAALLAGAIESLNERELTVLHLAYVERLAMDEVADAMGFGAPRVALVKKQALSRLYQKMDELRHSAD